jgi:putative spermidine/putrescine transport system permease protein
VADQLITGGRATEPVNPGRLSAARASWPQRHRWFFVALIPIAILAVLFGYPVFEMFRRSLTDFLDPAESGLANYQWFFDTPAQVTILRRTVVSALVTTGFALILGFPFAYLMTLVGFRWRIIMLGVVLMPFWTSLIVRTYSWIVLLQDNGPIVNLLDDLGFGRPRILGTTVAVDIGMTQLMLPFMILPLYAQLTRIDRSLLLAAQGLGASPAKAFRLVYLPLAVPGILAGATVVFILSLGFYFTPALLGSTQNSLLSQQIVQQVTNLLAFGRGGAMAVILLVFTFLLLGLGALLSRRYTKALGVGEVAR